MKQQDYYAFLGIKRNATPEQVNKAFREKAMECHPDRNKDNPNAAKEFKMLTQVLQTLTDPVRRAKYDASLPPEEVVTAAANAGPQAPSSIMELWKTAGNIFFEREERYTPAIDAMRQTMPLIMERDDLLIVGIAPSDSHLIGYLEASETHVKVRKIITELYGKELEFRLVTGTQLQDWTTVKEAEVRLAQRRQKADAARMASFSASVLPPPAPAPARPIIEPEAPVNNIQIIPEGPLRHSTPLQAAAPPQEAVALAEASVAPVAPPSGALGWDELLDKMMRQWGATDNRSYPQARAKFVFDWVPVISRADERSRAIGEPEDLRVRNLARVLERLASLTSIDTGAVGMEYVRYRRMLGEGV